MSQQINSKISNSEYDSLISNSLKNASAKEKSITSGKVISIENEIVTVDVGLKSEGRIPLSEFSRPGQKMDIEIGDDIEVFIENVDNANGETLLSREKAVRQKAWHNLQESFAENKIVTGVPFNRVKGGMSVDLDGVIAFLPGSQIDTRQIVKDTRELLNKPLELMILKMDKFRGNIVVSRKAITENELKEQRSELLKNVKEGSIIEGKVKNITDYGAFVDLGGIDGLVHVTDISWTKINNPSEALELNSTIKVKVLKFDEELSRLSLGIKQLTDNPWDKVRENIKVEEKILCTVISMNDNNVHVTIDNQYDGVISLSELSWLKKPPHPSKIVNMNQEIEVLVLEIDDDKKKINCSLKQMKQNPWTKLNEKFKINDTFETEIVNIVDFGIFVKVLDEIDGMVHISDLSWDEKECEEIIKGFKKGDKATVKILDINVEKERISLGIKHLKNDPVQDFIEKNPINSKVTGKIINIDEKGLKIALDSENQIFGFIKKSNLSNDKNENKVERFALEENIDSVIQSIDTKSRILNLSIKELEIRDEKEALTKYGSSASGASLGDILGSVLKK
ncbi:30S ribosomal protein S1 [Pelagibacteraceae bacterium]|nr:30S ribosomal protein S1 [Pelagibacteraceae bacterium]